MLSGGVMLSYTLLLWFPRDSLKPKPGMYREYPIATAAL